MARLGGCAAVACAAGACGVAAAASLPAGTYQLGNHPDGNQRPPLYGLRLDGLYGVNSEEYTFDFDDARSDMRMTVTATTIRIFGEAWGGEDIGSVYASNTKTGLYEIDFLYSVGVGLAAGDDDRIVIAANYANTGTIVAPNGHGTTHLASYNGSHSFGFRLGDEDNDAGHRGFSGISGWGWLAISGTAGGPYTHTDSQDWLFTVGDMIIPLPSAGGMGLAGLMLLGVRRRRA